MAKDTFLPNDYEVPSSGGNYMKLEVGENRFRILGSPVIGNELWISGKPVRKHMQEPFTEDELAHADMNKFTGKPKDVQHFWAMPVFNVKAKKIQILEITQKGIQQSIKDLTEDADWGNPRDYDLSVSKTGEGKETRYSVTPKPKNNLDEGIKQLYKDMEINMEALFESRDPFTKKTDAELVKEFEEVMGE